MTDEQKVEITTISQRFAEPFCEKLGGINGSGWLIVDPLSGYLNSCGYKNELKELPKCDKHPQILIIKFKDGSQFIPAGADLKPLVPESENWIWI